MRLAEPSRPAATCSPLCSLHHRDCSLHPLHPCDKRAPAHHPVRSGPVGAQLQQQVYPFAPGAHVFLSRPDPDKQLPAWK